VTARALRKLTAWPLLVTTVVILTLLTQIGGVVFLIALLIDRVAFPTALRGWRRTGAAAVLFAGLYAAISIFVLPPLAARAGRVALSCRAEPGDHIHIQIKPARAPGNTV
jgi:hypothetical protein